jgi:hypothetical protein
MGYDFKPRNKSAGDYQLGAFSWPFMLEAGLGLVLGIGEGFRPGEFIYLRRPDDLCVEYNYGARVTALECRELARVARWIAAVQEARLKQWATVSKEEQDRMRSEADRRLNSGESKLYKLPWHPDVIKRFRDFADWAERSGGFKIW